MFFSSHNKTTPYLCKVAGPVVLSAFSIFVTFHVLQPLALILDPSFSLLANKGVGKIGMTILVLLHILLLSATCSKQFFNQWKETIWTFIKRKEWVLPFSAMFLIFALFHTIVLLGFCWTGYLTLSLEKFSLLPAKGFSLLAGFLATFFLAWTEEAIFRGTLYPFLAQYMSRLSSIILSSLIFSLAHNLTNPLALVTTDWQLGLGLFGLGMFLNVLFAITGKLYISMGAHAGLVFIKVFLRRVPVIVPTIGVTAPWWFSPDLRMAFPVHVIFGIIIVALVVRHKRFLCEK